MAQHPSVGEAALLLLGAVFRFLTAEPFKAVLTLLWLLGLAGLLSAVWGSLKEEEPRAACLYGLTALGLASLGLLIL